MNDRAVFNKALNFAESNIEKAIYLSVVEHYLLNSDSVLSLNEVIVKVMQKGITRWPGEVVGLDTLAEYVSSKKPSTASDVKAHILDYIKASARSKNQ